jgi:hypothetical protein
MFLDEIREALKRELLFLEDRIKNEGVASQELYDFAASKGSYVRELRQVNIKWEQLEPLAVFLSKVLEGTSSPLTTIGLICRAINFYAELDYDSPVLRESTEMNWELLKKSSSKLLAAHEGIKKVLGKDSEEIEAAIKKIGTLLTTVDNAISFRKKWKTLRRFRVKPDPAYTSDIRDWHFIFEVEAIFSKFIKSGHKKLIKPVVTEGYLSEQARGRESVPLTPQLFIITVGSILVPFGLSEETVRKRLGYGTKSIGGLSYKISRPDEDPTLYSEKRLWHKIFEFEKSGFKNRIDPFDNDSIEFWLVYFRRSSLISKLDYLNKKAIVSHIVHRNPEAYSGLDLEDESEIDLIIGSFENDSSIRNA